MDEWKQTLTLSSPITDEQWDMLTDVDFDHTNNVTFHTKHGKVVEFVKADRWIPVTQDLPSDGEYVLCTTVTKKGLRQVVRGYYFRADGNGHWACGMNSNVVAWMPLPRPWEGEADDV